MLQSSLGRQPYAETLRQLRDRLIADSALRTIWNDYEISSPLLANACTIESAIGTFHYETLTLPFLNSHAIVVKVPDDASRKRLACDDECAAFDVVLIQDLNVIRSAR